MGIPLPYIYEYTEEETEGIIETYNETMLKSSGKPIIKKPTLAQLERAEQIKQQRKRDKNGSA